MGISHVELCIDVANMTRKGKLHINATAHDQFYNSAIMGILLSLMTQKLFGPQKAKIAMLGLDAAGKTTILYKLKLNEIVTTIPTIGFNVEEVTFHNLTMTIWDVGGQQKIRQLWYHYLENNDALIFVVDSSDRERFLEVKEEIFSLANDDRLTNAVILILANKQDLPNAATPAELTQKLDLPSIRGHPWYVQSCCAITGDGLVDGLSWLAPKIKERSKLNQ